MVLGNLQLWFAFSDAWFVAEIFLSVRLKAQSLDLPSFLSAHGVPWPEICANLSRETFPMTRVGCVSVVCQDLCQPSRLLTNTNAFTFFSHPNQGQTCTAANFSVFAFLLDCWNLTQSFTQLIGQIRCGRCHFGSHCLLVTVSFWASLYKGIKTNWWWDQMYYVNAHTVMLQFCHDMACIGTSCVGCESVSKTHHQK